MSLFSNTKKAGEENTQTPAQNRPQGGGLFANLQGQPATGAGGGGGLFGGGQQNQGSGGGLFGGGQQQPQGGGGGLFGGGQVQNPPEGLLQAGGSPPHQGGGMFGGIDRLQNLIHSGYGNAGGSPPRQGGGLFGGQTQVTQGHPQGGGGGSLFGGTRPQPAGLFGGGGGGQAQAQAEARPLNVHELQGNAPYNPNPTVSNTRKEGTVNYDLKFGRSNEGYDIYSITCASNADKNKSIEELRAEDYELIRSGELPEHLQLKLIENREKLEKSLGFALPVPTSTTAGKNYTRVFKSQTRNTSMKSSFLSNKYSDVTFKVGDESIPAHRNILGMCSQYFDDLFSKHESNTIPLVIEIHDAKPEAFKAILEFLYCSEVNLYEELAADLLLLAPRYDLNDLATGAEDFLNKIISADNYLKMIETSERISSKSLRKKVFAFMVRNMKIISKREDFEELPRPLLMELLDNAITA